ncbi:MAG: hypothetical protein HY720_17780 [Planctomycetes bacterium]|nr:hypothetical protein [Planctomycetota bacterium]
MSVRVPDEERLSSLLSEGPSTQRRRMFKVGPVFLRHYFLVWSVMTVAFIFATGAILLFSHRQLAGGAADPKYAENLSLIIRTNAIFILLVTLFMGTYTLLLSHRMAGPSYRINNSIRRALDDDYSFQIHLRENDFLHEVAENMNLLLQKLATREIRRKDREYEHSELVRRAEEIHRRGREIVQAAREKAADPEEVRALASALDEVLAELQSGDNR